MIHQNSSSETAALIATRWKWAGICLEWAAVVARPWTADPVDIVDGIYVKKVQYQTGAPSSCRFESHRREVDLQFIVDGSERIDLLPRAAVDISSPYDAKSDVEFYEPRGTLPTSLQMTPGDFAVFFPEDIHQCGWLNGCGKELRKYVFKIDISTILES